MKYEDIRHLERFLLGKFESRLVYVIIGVVKRNFDAFKKSFDEYSNLIISEIKEMAINEYLRYEEKFEVRGELSLIEKILLFLNEYIRTHGVISFLESKKISEKNVFSYVYGFLLSKIGIDDTDTMFLMRIISKWIALEIIKYDLYREIVHDIIRRKIDEMIEKTPLRKWLWSMV